MSEKQAGLRLEKHRKYLSIEFEENIERRLQNKKSEQNLHIKQSALRYPDVKKFENLRRPNIETITKKL